MDKEIFQLFNEDCLTGMKKMEDESVNLIVTDPPFNIGKKYDSPFKDSIEKTKYIDWCKEWLTECIRILKPKGSLYLFNYPENNAYLLPFLDEQNSMLFKNWITWHYHVNTGNSPYKFTRTQHSILFYSKSKEPADIVFNKNEVIQPYKNPTDKRIQKRMKEGHMGTVHYDVFSEDEDDGADYIKMNIVKNVSKDKTEHIAQLPVGLIDKFVRASSNPGDIVFDPFLGSGTVAVSAMQNKRKFVGFEISPVYAKVAEERVKKVIEQADLKDFIE